MPKPKSRFRRLTDSIAAGGLLVPHLERALVTQGEVWPEEYPIRVYNKERRFDGYFHPSSDAMKSELQLYYEYHPEHREELYIQPLSASDIMTFQVGSAYHALIQSMLIHLGFTTEDQIEQHFVNKKHHVSGTLDVRQLELPNGDSVPVEIKSAAFMREPPAGYIAQLNLYLDNAFDEPQDVGLLLICEKVAPHRLKEWIIKRDEVLLRRIYRKWNNVLEAIEFNDPSMLEYPCHELDTKAHKECPARFICRLGAPTGERPRYTRKG